MAYTNSPLVDYTKISPNRTKNRTHAIDTISIHCVVGQCSVEALGAVFSPPSYRASSNYGIGSDGRIGLYVEEKDRSWCTSSGSNDNRAVTIECASDTTHPYAVNSAVYNSLIKLVADICRRNGIKKLLWQNNKALIGQVDKQNMTVHCWFAAKACPGKYLLDRHYDIANKVNALLGASSPTAPTTAAKPAQATADNNVYRVQTGAFKNKTSAEAEKKKVEAAGFDAIVVLVNGLYKVQVGAYSKQSNAVATQNKLKAAGFATMIVNNSGTVSQTKTTKPLTVGTTVRVNEGAKTYNGKNLASFVYGRNHRIDSINGSRAVISYNGVIVAAMNVKDLTVV